MYFYFAETPSERDDVHGCQSSIWHEDGTRHSGWQQPCNVSFNPFQIDKENEQATIKTCYFLYYRWRVEVSGPADTLYDGEQFCLQFKFGPKYPFESPEVTFVGDKVPVHPHVYSNGHICLSILTEDWSPALSVETVCLSITSMLSTAKEKVLYKTYQLIFGKHY